MTELDDLIGLQAMPGPTPRCDTCKEHVCVCSPKQCRATDCTRPLSIIEELKARIRAAEKCERDHKGDSPLCRRELAGHTRGLRDALFVVCGEK